MKITIEWLEEKSACPEGIKWFLAQKKTKGIDMVEALISDDKLDWGNWLIVRLMDKLQVVRYAVFAAEHVIDIFEREYPHDKRPREAIEAAKKWIGNPRAAARAAARAASAAAIAAAWAASAAASDAARAAARAARAAAWAASDAAWAASDAARAAARAARAAAWAASDAAWAAAWAASDAARAAAWAASDAAWAASAAARAAMKIKIIRYGLSLLKEEPK